MGKPEDDPLSHDWLIDQVVSGYDKAMAEQDAQPRIHPPGEGIDGGQDPDDQFTFKPPADARKLSDQALSEHLAKRGLRKPIP